MIRLATAEDVDAMIALALEVYGPIFDVQLARETLPMSVQSPHLFVLIGNNVTGICCLAPAIFRPRLLRGIATFMVARKGHVFEACDMIRLMMRWAKQRSAVSFSLGADIGFDVRPIALRLGFSEQQSFSVTL